jgi:2-phospho-L-lactate guanylyltransferase
VVTVVVPFRSGGKSRLPRELRADLGLVMLGAVLRAGTAVADRVRLVTDDAAASAAAAELAVEIVTDQGGGQGAAVEAALAGVDGICLVVNADLPRALPSDLVALAGPPRGGAFAIVAAVDGSTNALGLPFANAFRPLYGHGSAARFRAYAASLGLETHDLELPNLRDDIDTVDDLERLGLLA